MHVGPDNYIPVQLPLTRRAYDIVAPVEGETYHQLLDFGLKAKLRFGLVIRRSQSYEQAADAILSKLEKHRVWRRRSASWPGTELVGGEADIAAFKMNDTTMSVLVQFADGLFDWCGPERPEDLWFETSKGDVLLGSIAHEEDAFMKLNDEEYEALRASGFPVQIFLASTD